MVGVPLCVKLYRHGRSSLLFPRFWSCGDSRIHESGMQPYLPCVRRKCLPLIGHYPPRTALWSSNQSATCQHVWGFLTVKGGVDPRMFGLPSPVDGTSRGVEGPLDRGWDPIYSGGGAGSTCKPWRIKKTVGRWGWDFHTVRRGINPDYIRVRPRVVGVVHLWMSYDPGMRPYRARMPPILCMNPGQ